MRPHGDKEEGNNGHSETPPSAKPRGLDAGIARLERARDAKDQARREGSLRGQRVRGWTEKLITRVASGAIYALVVIACLLLGRLATALLVMAMAWQCCSEFFHMTRIAGRMANEPLGLFMAALFALAPLTGSLFVMLALVLLLLVAAAGWYVVTPRASIGDVSTTVFGPLYTSLMFSPIVLIRMYDTGIPGALLVFGVIFSIWANDAMAFFVGSRIGRHKLAPKISPNKSIEGLVGGMVACMLIWVVMWASGAFALSLPLAVASGFVIGLFGVVGDLFESRIKRGVGLKDSGDFMPGHGGMLDRSDSLLFGCTVAFFMLQLGGIL